MQKQLIIPSRRRKVPDRFSWIDHRLVKQEHFKKSSSGAMKLYLFLATVSDVDGLSFYGARSLGSHLNLDASDILNYRSELITLDLIAYKKPFYQVLDLSVPTIDENKNVDKIFAELANSIQDKPKSIWREGNLEQSNGQTITEILNTYLK
jgi:hypothetical protein